MPVTNIAAARDGILGVFRTALNASAYATVPVFYDDQAKDLPSSGSWLRVDVQHVTGRQVNIGGAIGNRRYRYTGIVTVQIFTEYGKGQVDSDGIAQLMKTTFRGKNTGADSITFRNVRVVEAGQSGNWLQVNVLSDFDYDEVD
jgi:hypothetical protein